jgi:uncharacterized protein YciI
MLYAIIAKDAKDSLERRRSARPDHVAGRPFAGY